MSWLRIFVLALLAAPATLAAPALAAPLMSPTAPTMEDVDPGIDNTGRDREFVRFWMSGYYNAASNSNILNYDRLQKNSAKVAAYCKSHKSQSLPTAIKNIGLWD